MHPSAPLTPLTPRQIPPFLLYFPLVLNHPDPRLESFMSKSSYARRKAHRALGRDLKEGKLDETAAAAYKTVEDKRLAKIKAAKEKAKQ
jgi:hypothetical protein